MIGAVTTPAAVELHRHDPGADPLGHETWSVIFPLARPVFSAHCSCGWHSVPTFDGHRMLRDRYDHLIATGTFEP